MQPVVMAILGGTSHIAKSLIAHFCETGNIVPVAFVRSIERMRHFSQSLSVPVDIRDFAEFESDHYDLVINCVGAGGPAKLGNDFSKWFTLTEEFDGRAINYLRQINPDALYINFSSGGIYGKGHDSGMDQDTLFSTPVNDVPTSDYYSIVRLYTESKHRSMADLNIVDIRIFSWFSRYADPNSGYFMTDVMRAIKDGTVLNTSSEDMVRDYPSPHDLCQLIRLCTAKKTLNLACDLYSVKPAGKFEILDYLQNHFALKYKKDDNGIYAAPNGQHKCYCSRYRKAQKLGYCPGLTSIQTIHEEIDSFLKGKMNVKCQ